jgi:hypothetical protein
MKTCAGLLLCLLMFACASGPVSQPAQETPALGSWKVWGFTNDPGSFYLVDTDVRNKENLMRAIHDSRKIFRRFSSDNADSILQPLGAQPEIEKIADTVCASTDTPPRLTPEEFYKLSQLNTKGLDISNPVVQQVFSAGTVATDIEFPFKGEAPRVASAVVTCRDPSGARFAAAQARGAQSLAIVTQSVAVMRTMKFKAAESSRLTAKKDKDLLALKVSRLLLTESRSSLRQYQVALKWLESDPAKAAYDTSEAKGAKIYDQVLKGMLQGNSIMSEAVATATKNTDQVEKQLASKDPEAVGAQFDPTVFDHFVFESE